MRNFTFFDFIRRYFGGHIVNNLKKCMNILKSIVHTQIRIKFLRDCIRHDLVPTHLGFMKVRHLQFHSIKYLNLFKKFNNTHILHILRLELKDSYSFLYSLRSEFFNLFKTISYVVPSNIVNRFFYGQERSNGKLWLSLVQKVSNKIEKLIHKQKIISRSGIVPISFSVNNTNDEQVKVSISQNEFGYSATINKIQEKWFVNLSGHNIPTDVISLLQLGERFNLPLTNKKITTFEIIKSIERNLDRQDIHIQNTIRNDTIPLIHDLCQYIENDNTDKILKNWSSTTRKFINDNTDIIFTKADKGNTTVALHRADYISKMNELLLDNNTYEVVVRDPIRRITDSLHSLLTRWKKNGYINEFVYKNLNKTDGLLPRAYGLPKLHKQGCPLRIIISSIDSPLYSFANYLHHIIQKSLSFSKSFIKNSFDLVEKLRNLHISSDFHLASLDVISLFTNVPVDFANNSLEKRWCFISQNTLIPKNEFFIGINLILNSTFFVFNNIFYKQIFGTPMGSPLSPIIADIVMQDLEELALNKLPGVIPLYYRYVDDVLFAARERDFDVILETFNSVHERLQFTIERSTGDCINFLNVSIRHTEDCFSFDLYYKPTFSYRYLNFYSHHPLVHKKSVITGLVDKVILLSEPELYYKNLKSIISTLMENGYPLELIFSTINQRIRFLSHNGGTSRKNRENNNNRKYFPIPYIKCISDRFTSALRKHDFSTAFFCNNNLQKFIKTGKDGLDLLNHCGVVYKISCKDCEATYVGQTKRKLRTRIKEHRSDINKKTGSPSVISSHRLDLNHEFGWNEVEILDRENSYNKRLISEMIHIKRQANSLNKQTDTELFPDSYLTVLNLFPSS